MSKEKETKEPKHRPEALRQPQRKDSLSSVLSWAGLQTKPGSPRSTVNLASSLQQLQSQPSPGAGTGTGTGTTVVKSRRHSHGPEVKKARKGSTSTVSRRLSFSNIGGTQEGASAKTRHTKTISTVDSKPTDTSDVSSGTKTSKSSSSEKVNKQAQEKTEGHAKISHQKKPTSDKVREVRVRSASVSEGPTSPKIIPKSILRVASPDGHRPLRRIVAYPAPVLNLQNGQPSSTDQASLSPLQQILPDITEDSGPGSPPTSPISRPLSPGATVRFAKATVHRVEVGPGRRFAPVKRKSKSTIPYIAPLDTGTQKSMPKAILTSPTKLRRHVENQKAMGRYWMRTEEEEAQCRVQDAMKAEKVTEMYRAEPASPPGLSVLASSPAFHGFSWVDGLDALDKLPPIDSLSSLDNLEADEAVDKLETEISDSDDSDTEDSVSGAKLIQDDEEDDERDSAAALEGGKLIQAKTETSDLKKPESQPQGGGGVTLAPSAEATAGVGIQEVKVTTTPATAATQEAKTTISRPAIETSPLNPATAKTPSLSKLTNKDAQTAERKPVYPLPNPVTANPKSPETKTKSQTETKASPAITGPRSAAQGGKTAATTTTTTRPPLIKPTSIASAPTTTTPPNRNQPTPTLIITPSSLPPQRTLSPPPPRRSPLRPTASIYINNTGATVSSSGTGEKQHQPTTSNTPPPTRTSPSHLRLSGRRGRRFDTPPPLNDHGKQGHEIAA